MQNLADKALAKKHGSRFPTAGTRSTAAKLGGNKMATSQKHGATIASVTDQDGGQVPEDGEHDEVSDLLALWRLEVLKLLLQRREIEAATAEDSRKAATRLREERDARARTEAEAKVYKRSGLQVQGDSQKI